MRKNVASDDHVRQSYILEFIQVDKTVTII